MTSAYLILLLVIIGAGAATALFFCGLWQVVRAIFTRERIEAIKEILHLTRTETNPILEHGPYQWEAESVLNPAVVEAGGKTHMFYRAVGSDGVSRLGYASSDDGVTFDERLPYPVFASNDPRGEGAQYRYDPILYPSGGSWGGCEDPRAVVIDGRLYVTFNMFDGWDYIRVAITSLSVDDLIAKRWNWTKPAFLSPKGEIHKNWVMFPEKIKGQFAFLHNLHADDPEQVRVEYIDHPAQLAQAKFYSPDPAPLPDRPMGWHKRMRSAGPPPLKTALGWLLFYHATDGESHRYKMGAMLLDLLDPTHVIARSPEPVLVPDASYENEGKPGIVYGCGATIKGDTVRVYYGGGDRVVCAASASLSSFLDTLINHGINHGTPQLARI